MSAPKSHLRANASFAIRGVMQLLAEEKGIVESTLVIIPLVILFLSIVQIASVVIQHDALENQVQGDISRSALYGARSPFEGATKRPLPGGGALIIGGREVSALPISPIFGAQSTLKATSIAVDENS